VAAWGPAGSVDLLSEQLYGEVAAEAYAWMRREAPVHHDEVNDLWAIATWDDVSAASRDSATSRTPAGHVRRSRRFRGCSTWTELTTLVDAGS
jgi:hypothetical protein